MNGALVNAGTEWNFFFFFLTALLAFYSVTIVMNEKLHVQNCEGKKKINKFKTVGIAKRE